MSNQCQVEPSVGVEVPEGHNLSLGNVGQYVGGGVRLQQGEANAQQLAVRGGALSRNWSVSANTSVQGKLISPIISTLLGLLLPLHWTVHRQLLVL